jgi:glycosyltransferase involved in cell wall biosynthesis
LHQAAVGCLTSQSEGFSNALLEYMAAGLPVVATQTGGAAEVVQEGLHGHLVAPGDAAALADRLLALVRDPASARAMGAQARQRVADKFTMDIQLEHYYRLYDELYHLTHSRT